MSYWHKADSFSRNRSASIALANHELRLCLALPLQISPEQTTRNARDTILKRCFCQVEGSVTDLTRHLESLLSSDLARHLPNSVIGCAALPLGLHILGLRLSSNTASSRAWYKDEMNPSIVSGRRKHLEVLISTMRACHSRYDGVDWISTAIGYYMECTYWDDGEPLGATCPDFPMNSSLMTLDASQARFLPGDFDRNLAHYLRLAATIDLSLSLDRLPQEQDFPPSLMPLNTVTGCFVPALFSSAGKLSIERSHDGQQGNSVDIVDVLSSISLPVPSSGSLSGWVENDRSLYFALEMGLGPSLLDVT